MPDNTLLNLQDLRAIVHSLKMAGLSFVDPEAVDAIKDRIRALPSAEDLNKLAKDKGSMNHLTQEIGDIMKLIEVYGNRDPEFKARYKSRTGLPPRYKVLEWRGNMKQEAMQVVKQMIKTSAVIDEKGNGKLAGDLIKCAKKMQSDEIDGKSFDQIIEDVRLAGFDQEAGLLKEAALPWMQGLQDMWSGAKEVGKSGFKGLKGAFNVGKYRSIMDRIVANLKEVLVPNEIQAALAGASTAEQKQELTKIFNQMKNMKYMADTIKGQFEVIGHEVVPDVEDVPVPSREMVEEEPTEELNKMFPIEEEEVAKKPSLTPSPIVEKTTEPVVEPQAELEVEPEVEPETEDIAKSVVENAPSSATPQKPSQKPPYSKSKPPKSKQRIKWLRKDDNKVTEYIVGPVDRRKGTFMATTLKGYPVGPLEISKILPDNTKVTAGVSTKFNLKKFASK